MTFHAQTAAFGAAVLQALPRNMSARIMQGWMRCPLELQKALATTLCSIRCWSEENGMVRFSVTSNGMAGTEWMKYVRDNGNIITDDLGLMLLSQNFKPTQGVTTEIVVLSASQYRRHLAGDAVVTFKLTPPAPEVACLICNQIPANELRFMGFSRIRVCHPPVNIYKGERWFVVSVAGGRDVAGLYSVSTMGDLASCSDDDGFAFAIA